MRHTKSKLDVLGKNATVYKLINYNLKEMDSIGAEVGQKMRSAIKAKLLELNCYVDNELPDYVMVMVANRRTKIQMTEDLSLFLDTKTEMFVEWLHVVLEKLKAVTVTNPEVYKRVTKRKSIDQGDVKIKKEKKIKKLSECIKGEHNESLTDNLPIIPNKLSEHRTITLVDETRWKDKTNDEFDIPLLSEVNTSNEKDLKEIERKIRNVKSRLGILVDNEFEGISTISENDYGKTSSNDLDCIKEKHEYIDIQVDPETVVNEINLISEKKRKHSPITFQNDEKPQKKPSVLQRLGERIGSRSSDYKNREERLKALSRERHNDKKDSKSDSRLKKTYRADRNRPNKRKSREKFPKSRRESTESPRSKSRSDNKNAICQVGVMSKIHIPEKAPEEPDHEDELKTREVRSMVQVKPRVLAAGTPQPNKNLLLKAVAEANRSVCQVSNNKPRILDKLSGEVPNTRKLSQREKVKLRNIILAQVSRDDSDSNDGHTEYEYVPKPITKRNTELPKYVPSLRQSVDEIIKTEPSSSKTRISAKARLERRKSPSPIIFDKSTRVLNKAVASDNLLLSHTPISVKIRERCKYWPTCRQGDKCEFIHPESLCEMFPNCQFRDKCLYIHPACKFGTACTKRECFYSHNNINTIKAPVVQPPICKFFPKCTNSTCSFYHPKLCRFGKYCKNQVDCPFSHVTGVKKTSHFWR